jgi:hypothetical protein
MDIKEQRHTLTVRMRDGHSQRGLARLSGIAARSAACDMLQNLGNNL